jgi:LPS-assembly lipoprotein
MIALSLSMALVACGFHLRGDGNYAFATLFLNSSQALPITGELTHSLEGISSAKLVATAKGADVILEVNSVEDTKSILSLSSGGRVAEYLLSKRVLFRVHDNDGKEWLPTSEVLVRRSYTYSDTETLAKEAQEQRLLREMQTDAVQQVVRRLQAAKKPPE